MKPLPLFLTASLVVNATLLAVILNRQPAIRSADACALVSKTDGRNPSTTKTGGDRALLMALNSGDLSALAAAGVPTEVARQLAAGRAYMRRLEQMRALQTKLESAAPYWRGGAGFEQYNREFLAELNKIGRAHQHELRQALGEDYTVIFDRGAPLAYLPAATRDALRRIEADYGELMSEIHGAAAGVELPSDQEKLQLLRTEKERDIAALLGPGGYEEYQLRTSATALNVRLRFGSVIQNEEEFRQVYALQKAFDDRFNITDPAANARELQQARREALPELQQQIAALLGPERYQEAQRVNDPEYRTLNALAARLNLPAGTADSVLASRDTYASQSQQINADPALTREERTAQLRALAARAETSLQQTLGADAVQTYAQRSPWLGALKNGKAFSTSAANPSGAVNIMSPAVTVLPPGN